MKRRLTGCLLDNNLNKEFEATIFPLNLMQTITLQPKYRIRRGFVVQNGFLNYVLCILGICLILFLHITKALDQLLILQSDLNTFLHLASIFDAVFYIFATLVMFTENLILGKINVELIIKIYEVYRYLACPHVVKVSRNYNWFWFCLIFSTYLFFAVLSILIGNVKSMNILCGISIVYLDVNIIFAMQIIKFLTLEINLWRLEMENFRVSCSNTNDKYIKKYTETRGEILYITYLNILKASTLFEKIFHKTVISIVAKAFWFIWACKSVGLLCCLCAACQQFYLAVRDVDAANAIKLSDELCWDSFCLVGVRRLSKQVSRLNAAWTITRGVHAGGLFRVDAALPLRLLQLLAAYTVVLLQFAFV
ncbi:uncharacterized protein LOC133521725 [Cydia pomonella]|uniref:uncharacterized protein LOC133521725 n=1 Tax=Cydia pomonella TaxID=82600 RepID=UPI002ADD89F0|nr:uncharacterized protein LOC133521725 [Cydia pomonella]